MENRLNVVNQMPGNAIPCNFFPVDTNTYSRLTSWGSERTSTAPGTFFNSVLTCHQVDVNKKIGPKILLQFRSVPPESTSSMR
jgi:hypothetical protein